MNTPNWALWLTLAMTYCLLTYNPAYQLLLLLALSAVAASKKQPLKTYIKVGLLVSAIPLFVNIFLVHRGETALFTIPRRVSLLGFTIPLIAFGGPITMESTATGVIMAIFLVNMLTAFQVFNNTTTPDSILTLIPSSMPGVSLAVSIALRFIPTVVRDHGSIRDAQVSRGVRLDSGSLVTRIGNHLNTIVPTVVTSLERGFNLSESMVSRGYTGKRTSYRNESWSLCEKLTALAYASAILLTVYAKYSSVFEYWPYDSLTIPGLSAVALMPLLALTIPVIQDERS